MSSVRSKESFGYWLFSTVSWCIRQWDLGLGLHLPHLPTPRNAGLEQVHEAHLKRATI